MYMYAVASNYRIINHSDLIQLFTEYKKSLYKDTMKYSNKESWPCVINTFASALMEYRSWK